MTKTSCGRSDEHKAHRYFDDENVSRPCSGLLPEIAETEEAGVDLTYNTPMGADMTLVTGEAVTYTRAPVTPLEAIAVLRKWLDERPHRDAVVTVAQGFLSALERDVKESL
jgi:hypothetical protein